MGVGVAVEPVVFVIAGGGDQPLEQLPQVVDAAGLELHRRDRGRGAADEGERLSLAGPELLGDRLDPVGDVDDVGVAGGRDRELFAANGDALTVAEGCASFGR
jgi:hypothetical protein